MPRSGAVLAGLVNRHYRCHDRCHGPSVRPAGRGVHGRRRTRPGLDQLCVWTISVAAAHVSDQPHTLDRDEVFTVISGTVCLQHDAEPLQAGDTAVVPAGVPIQVANPGSEPARVVVSIQAGFTASAADGTAIGTPPWAR
jgi:mannose-6-phosphate isomerase-like protein (cupin superfamily)